MAFQQIPQCVEVTFNQSQQGVPVVNRWYVDVGHAVTHDDLTGVFAVVDAWVTSSLAPVQVTTIQYESIVVKDVDHANGEELVFVPTTTAGGNTQVATANSTALVASLRTNLSGKNYRGRTYVGGLSLNTLQDSTHATTVKAAQIADIMTDLMDGLATATYALVVVSKILLGVQRAVAVVTEVVSIIVNTTLDNQRRRTAN